MKAWMKVWILTVAFFVMTLSQGILHGADLRYKGELSFEHWYFPKDAFSPNQINMNNTAELKFETILEIDFFKMLIAPRIKEDFSLRSRSRLLLDEGWIQFVSKVFEARLGIQQFNWGMVESQKLVDVLNQRDYEDDFFEPDKLGELSGRFRFAITDKMDLRLYYLTNFTKAQFPEKDSRYSLSNGFFDISENAIYGDSLDEWAPQYAARLFATVGPVDLGFSYFHGYNRFPSIDFLTGQSYYNVMDQAGLEVTWVIKKLIVKLEAAYRNMSQTDIARVPSRLIPDWYVAYVGGIEYTVSQVIKSHDMTLFLEYLGDTDYGTDTVDFRLFQNDVFLGLRYSLNDVNSRELMLGATFDLEDPREFFFLVSFKGRFKEDFIYELRMDGVQSREGSRLDLFKEELRIKAKLSYSFSS